MSNNLTELNNQLFAQLKRINNEALAGEDLEKEIERSKAVTGISKTIIDNAKLALDAEKFRAEYRGFKDSDTPPMLTNKSS